jgi:hypothetical protein
MGAVDAENHIAKAEGVSTTQQGESSNNSVMQGGRSGRLIQVLSLLRSIVRACICEKK